MHAETAIRPRNWVWIVPYLAVGVFALAMLALVWGLQKRETDLLNDALGRDVQWAERTMRLHMQGAQDYLVQLAREMAEGKLDRNAFLVRATQHLANTPEMASIVWVDSGQIIRWAAPFETTDWIAGERLAGAQPASFAHALVSGRPTYGEAYVNHRGAALLELYVPVQFGRTYMGTLVGVYTVEGMLRHLVPAWFGEKYSLAIVDAEGRALGTNTTVMPADDALGSDIGFDPPGNGLRLRAKAFRTDPGMARVVPLILIAGLTLLVVWSLWALRSHFRRRVKVEKERDRLFNLSLDMLCIAGLDGGFRRVNPAFGRVLGYAAEDITGKPLLDYVHPEDLAGAVDALRQLAAGRPASFEGRWRAADGSYRWLLWAINPVPEEKLLYAVAHDITGRREDEEQLKSAYAFRKAMGESLITGIRAIDMEGRIIFVNAAFCRMTGLAEQDLLGRRPPFPYWPPEEAGMLRRHLEQTLAGQVPQGGFEMRIMHRDGRRFDVQMYVSPLIDSGGRQVGWMASMNDITERKRMEAETLRQQERLEQTSRLITMGEMASSLAHELNQPLSAIANYCMGSVNRLRSGDYRREEILAAMEKASAQAERAGKIIRRTREFVKKSAPVRAPVALAEIVEEAIGFADIEARKAAVKLRVAVPADLPPVFADRIMIEQVVLNLVKNGIEAMQQTPPGERTLGLDARLGGDGMVEAAVSDRGCGLNDEQIERLFTPFFTTKPEGMGMGLNICRSIVEYHDGRLWVEPNPGGGSVFRFTLPAHAPLPAGRGAGGEGAEIEP
ncbi:two-component system, LuxR family, sensor histidine kinase DctS [Rhodocyclaceae bacterium]|nr:two-component system, LuxR family, sensor histidine kinase DctS [Rhodocyclaceae bacterium]